MKLRVEAFSLSAIFILSIIFTSCLVNDADSPAPEDIFVKYYGGDGEEIIAELGYLPVTDEYLIFGSSSSNDDFGAGLNDLFLVKTSPAGNVSEIRFPDFTNGSDSSNETASSMKVVGDQILLAGTTEVRINDLGVFSEKYAFYMLYDSDLNEIFRDTIGMPGVDVVGNDITATSDGNYVVLSTIGDAISGERNLMFTKVSPTGQTIWNRLSNIPGDDVGISIIELSNGNLAVCASTERVSVRGFRGINVLFLVLNPLGFINNSLSYGTASATSNVIDDIPSKMIRDGTGALIVGSSNIDDEEIPFVIPLTPGGAINGIRSINFEDQPNGVRFNDITRALNGDLLITGDFVNFRKVDDNQGIIAQRQEALFLRTDQLGEEIFNVGNFGDNFDESGKAILQLPDGKVLLGATVSFGGSNSKIGLLKLSATGSLSEE